MLKQATIIICFSVILGLGINIISPNKIPYIGKYRNISSGDRTIIPPTAEPGDPPFIAIDIAEMEYNFKEAIFIDARAHEDFVCGTIPGSINIPFDNLPESDTEYYIDSMLNFVSNGQPLIVFCSGDECDLSLQLARYLQEYGYTDVTIFYGGAREWEIFGLDMERREECGE